MLVVAGLSLRNLHPRVWDEKSPYYLPNLKAVMLSYGEFHQMAARRKQVMKIGLHEYLGLSKRPKSVRVYLDNGAFHFLRQNEETERKHYRDFVKKAKPDWYPIPFDSIPTPQMCNDDQRACFKRTMDINRWYEHDGYIPVIHASRLLAEYIQSVKANTKLLNKRGLALGGMVPNLLRMPKAVSHSDLLAVLEQVRSEFPHKELHVFGIGGTATLHIARLLGMDSVDSSGWRNRAARGLVQLPGCGDRMVKNLGNWRGRLPNEEEWAILRRCQCPACAQFGLKGLKSKGLLGFCNRATHNLHILLSEAEWIEKRIASGTYPRAYAQRLDNTVYRPLIKKLVKDMFSADRSRSTSNGRSRNAP